jgi:hypothetical protein
MHDHIKEEKCGFQEEACSEILSAEGAVYKGSSATVPPLKIFLFGEVKI